MICSQTKFNSEVVQKNLLTTYQLKLCFAGYELDVSTLGFIQYIRILLCYCLGEHFGFGLGKT